MERRGKKYGDKELLQGEKKKKEALLMRQKKNKIFGTLAPSFLILPWSLNKSDIEIRGSN